MTAFDQARILIASAALLLGSLAYAQPGRNVQVGKQVGQAQARLRDFAPQPIPVETPPCRRTPQAPGMTIDISTGTAAYTYNGGSTFIVHPA